MSNKKYTAEEIKIYITKNNIISKTCKKCKEDKDLDLFSNSFRIKDGKRTNCKECESINGKEYSITYTKEEINDYRLKNNITTKICQICNEEKSLKLFYNSSRSIDGSYSRCKKCDTKSYTKTQEEIDKYIVDNNIINKNCIKCKCSKKLEEFHIQATKIDGRRAICKECILSYSNVKENYTPEEIAKYLKDNDITSKMCTRCKEEKDLSLFHNRFANKNGKNSTCKDCDNILEKEAGRHQKKYEKVLNDPCLYIRMTVSFAILSALRKNDSSKEGESCLTYLPYTIQELKEHIEKQFEPWMNWNNRGKYKRKAWDDNNQKTWKWQLDHIIPQSDLPYTSMSDENFKKCWALDNLRPYSAKQNVIDGANRTRHDKKKE